MNPLAEPDTVSALSSRPPSNRLAPSPERWRWMALTGAAAGSAAATSAALGGVVQITQVGNEVTSTADNLRADLTGDGIDDLPELQAIYGPVTFTWATSNTWFYRNIAYAFFSPATGGPYAFQSLGDARYFIRGFGTTPFSNTTSWGFRNWVGGHFNYGSTDSSGLVPVRFSDARINSGQPTNGLLEVRAFSTSPSSHTVRLVRLVFDDASTAAPTGVVPGGTNPEFGTSPPHAQPLERFAQMVAISNMIALERRRLRSTAKRLRRAKQRGQVARVRSMTRSIKRIRQQIRTLHSQWNSLSANSV